MVGVSLSQHVSWIVSQPGPSLKLSFYSFLAQFFLPLCVCVSFPSSPSHTPSHPGGGGCKRLASDPVTHGHHLPQLLISSRVSICFRFFLQVARVKLHPRSLSQVTCFIFPLFLRAASQFTSAPFLQVARVKLHPHSPSQVTCIILLPLFLFLFSLPFLVLSPSFLSDFSCHKPRCLPGFGRDWLRERRQSAWKG